MIGENDNDEDVTSKDEPMTMIDEGPPENVPSNGNDLTSYIFGDDYDTTPPQNSRSIYTKAANGETERDIGDIYTAGPKKGEEFTSKEQVLLESIYDVFGGDQMRYKRMECALQWKMDKALRS